MPKRAEIAFVLGPIDVRGRPFFSPKIGQKGRKLLYECGLRRGSSLAWQLSYLRDAPRDVTIECVLRTLQSNRPSLIGRFQKYHPIFPIACIQQPLGKSRLHSSRI